jgi:hypothetical protein
MLSEKYDIREFIDKVRDLSFEEVIVLADREATFTERHLYKDCRRTKCERASQYARSLKDFILFMRHGVRTQSTRDLNLNGFRDVIGQIG